jgi:hypothetical protein
VDDEFARFDVTVKGASATDDYRNEASTYGYIVEIDPYNSSTLATKRTALGRFRHEGCAPGLPVAGKPLVWYMGDDSNNEYLYKWVSTAVWDAADANLPTAWPPAPSTWTRASSMWRASCRRHRVWLLLDVAPLPNGSTLGAVMATCRASSSTPVAPAMPWAQRRWTARNGPRSTR